MGASIYSRLRDSGRIVATGLISEVFAELTEPQSRKRPASLFGVITGIDTLTRTAPHVMGGTLHEIGLLAGTTHPEYGNVSAALRLAADELRHNYLTADNAQNYRRCQDGAHVLLHLANNCLPTQAAGSRPEDIKPLRESFQQMQAEADYEHVIKLSGVALRSLGWRQVNHQLGKLATEPLSLSADMKKQLADAEPLYSNLREQSACLITALTLQKAAIPGV